MGSRVQCFMLEPLARAQRSLRRYDGSVKLGGCPGPFSYHNASVVLDQVDYPLDLEWDGDGIGNLDHGDPRWPAACACGYGFKPEDQWQVNTERLYRCPDGSIVTERKAPPGAMWFARYYAAQMAKHGDMFGVGPDGQALMVMLPDGTEWHVDGPARNSQQPWQRTGVPPLVVARPSIAVGNSYHGWLGGPGGNEPGWLVEC